MIKRQSLCPLVWAGVLSQVPRGNSGGEIRFLNRKTRLSLPAAETCLPSALAVISGDCRALFGSSFTSLKADGTCRQPQHICHTKGEPDSKNQTERICHGEARTGRQVHPRQDSPAGKGLSCKMGSCFTRLRFVRAVTHIFCPTLTGYGDKATEAILSFSKLL